MDNSFRWDSKILRCSPVRNQSRISGYTGLADIGTVSLGYTSSYSTIHTGIALTSEIINRSFAEVCQVDYVEKRKHLAVGTAVSRKPTF